MTVFIPIYACGHKVIAVDGDLLIKHPTIKHRVVMYKKDFGYISPFYMDDVIFKTEEAAWKYWHKEPIKEEERYHVEQEINPNQIRRI